MIRTFTAKLGNMRKPQEFVTYPRKSATDPVVIQSDKSIGCFDPITGIGRLSLKGNKFINLRDFGSAYSPVPFAEPYTFPPEVVKLAIEAGAVTADGTVRIVGGE